MRLLHFWSAVIVKFELDYSWFSGGVIPWEAMFLSLNKEVVALFVSVQNVSSGSGCSKAD